VRRTCISPLEKKTRLGNGGAVCRDRGGRGFSAPLRKQSRARDQVIGGGITERYEKINGGAKKFPRLTRRGITERKQRDVLILRQNHTHRYVRGAPIHKTSKQGPNTTSIRRR